MSKIENYVSTTEYAALYGLSPQAVKKRCQRGGFKTARKIGRNWVIDKNEVFTDRRVSTGAYKNWRRKDEE